MSDAGAKPESRPAEIILLVEDSPSDAALITRAFDRSGVENPIRRVKDGEEALAYLAGSGAFADRKENPLPAVILLDLNLPRFNGYQLMIWLRTQPELKRIPVVVLTESRDAESINRAYDAGANSYLVKPGEASEIARVVDTIRQYWMSMNEPPRISLRPKT
jgi:CheY-like chemotaxis protein